MVDAAGCWSQRCWQLPAGPRASFYDPLSLTTHHHPGDILRTAPSPDAPAGSTATRMLYMSTTPNGRLVAVSALVIVPSGARAGSASAGMAASHHRSRAWLRTDALGPDPFGQIQGLSLPHLTTNGEQGSLDKSAQWGTGKTLRQLAMQRFEAVEPELEFIGSPETVAERMGQVIEVVGGDGFLISTPFQRTSRRFITEVTERLVPALQRRGLTRTAYAGSTLRDVLREF